MTSSCPRCGAVQFGGPSGYVGTQCTCAVTHTEQPRRETVQRETVTIYRVTDGKREYRTQHAHEAAWLCHDLNSGRRSGDPDADWAWEAISIPDTGDEPVWGWV